MNWISIVNLTSELMDDCSLQRSHSKWDNTGNRHSTLQQEMESIPHGNLCVALRTTTKTTANKNKDDNKWLQWYNGETKLQCCSAWQKRQTMECGRSLCWASALVNERSNAIFVEKQSKLGNIATHKASCNLHLTLTMLLFIFLLFAFLYELKICNSNKSSLTWDALGS